MKVFLTEVQRLNPPGYLETMGNILQKPGILWFGETYKEISCISSVHLKDFDKMEKDLFPVWQNSLSSTLEARIRDQLPEIKVEKSDIQLNLEVSGRFQLISQSPSLSLKIKKIIAVALFPLSILSVVLGYAIRKLSQRLYPDSNDCTMELIHSRPRVTTLMPSGAILYKPISQVEAVVKQDGKIVDCTRALFNKSVPPVAAKKVQASPVFIPPETSPRLIRQRNILPSRLSVSSATSSSGGHNYLRRTSDATEEHVNRNGKYRLKTGEK